MRCYGNITEQCNANMYISIVISNWWYMVVRNLAVVSKEVLNIWDPSRENVTLVTPFACADSRRRKHCPVRIRQTCKSVKRNISIWQLAMQFSSHEETNMTGEIITQRFNKLVYHMYWQIMYFCRMIVWSNMIRWQMITFIQEDCCQPWIDVLNMTAELWTCQILSLTKHLKAVKMT